MSDVVKAKIRQLYQFLKEANQLRFRPVRILADQPKVVRLADMPNHLLALCQLPRSMAMPRAPLEQQHPGD